MLVFGISRSERASYLSKYLSVYIWTYADLGRDRYRHVRPLLNLNLDLNLNLARYPALNRASFRKSFEKSNPALFRQWYGFKYRQLFDSVNLAPYREV